MNHEIKRNKQTKHDDYFILPRAEGLAQIWRKRKEQLILAGFGDVETKS